MIRAGAEPAYRQQQGPRSERRTRISVDASSQGPIISSRQREERGEAYPFPPSVHSPPLPPPPPSPHQRCDLSVHTSTLKKPAPGTGRPPPHPQPGRFAPTPGASCVFVASEESIIDIIIIIIATSGPCVHAVRGITSPLTVRVPAKRRGGRRRSRRRRGRVEEKKEKKEEEWIRKGGRSSTQEQEDSV